VLQTKESESKVTEVEACRRRLPTRYLAHVLGAISIAFGLIAVVRVCHLILTVGGNNISNDYIGVTPFIDKAFSGQINLSNIFSNLNVGQHVVAVPIAFHYLSAALFDWNARAELLVGVALNFIRAVLIWDVLAGNYSRRWSAFLFGAVLALVFSMTQASIHFFGQACYPVSLTTFGFTLALWGIYRFRNDWRGPVLMLIGGISAALSMGNVPPCWFALLVGLVLFGYGIKRWPVYLVWTVGLAASLAPYAHFLYGHTNALSAKEHSNYWLFIINLLGRPFSNEVGMQVGRLPMAEYIGTAGLIMFAVALVANLRFKRLTPAMKVSLVLCAYGLASAIMLSGVRVFVTPWYGAFAIYFWIGLIGMFLAALRAPSENVASSNARELLASRTTAAKSDRIWQIVSIVCLCTIPIAYCLSNRSWKDKHVYLFTRSPASESALRNFRSGPSYLESLLFQWGDGRPENVTTVALPLETYQLSAFSPEQSWSLQGDFILPGVRVFNRPGVSNVRFIEDKSVNHPVPWSHYERANLYVHSPNMVSWTFALPKDLVSARLQTAFTIGFAGKKNRTAITDGARGQVFASINDGKKQLLQETQIPKPGQWLPIDVDLSKLAGKTVTLILTSDGGKDKLDDFSIFQYPHIDVKLRRRSQEENKAIADRKIERQTWVPVNTDLHPGFREKFDKIMALPGLSDPKWQAMPFAISTPFDVRCDDKDSRHVFPARSLSLPQPIPLADYSHLLFSMKAPAKMSWRSLKVGLILDNGKQHSFSVPLVSGEESHLFSYDLKLCEIASGSRLKSMVLYPVSVPGADSPEAVSVSSVSLARERLPSWEGNF
jgi:hypothetical protein